MHFKLSFNVCRYLFITASCISRLKDFQVEPSSLLVSSVNYSDDQLNKIVDLNEHCSMHIDLDRIIFTERAISRLIIISSWIAFLASWKCQKEEDLSQVQESAKKKMFTSAQ